MVEDLWVVDISRLVEVAFEVVEVPEATNQNRIEGIIQATGIFHNLIRMIIGQETGDGMIHHLLAGLVLALHETITTIRIITESHHKSVLQILSGARASIHLQHS